MSQPPAPVSTPPSRASRRERHRIRPDDAELTGARVARTLWTAASVVVLLCLCAAVLGGSALPDKAVLQNVAIGLVALTVLCVTVRVTGTLGRMRAAAPSDPSAQRPAPSPDQASAHPSPEPSRAPSPLDRLGASTPEHSDLFVTLSRRQQALGARLINEIDALERQLEDPGLLKVLFRIDHLASRARRQSENLAVLGGTLIKGRNSAPEPVAGVLRAAVAETEHYAQIVLVAAVDVHLRGHVVAEIVHLLAELMENATKFTSPDSPKVAVRASLVAAGLAIDIEDRGVGIQADRLRRLNAMLDGALDADLRDVVSEGHIGLAVVRLLASHHDVKVRLNHNIYGGVDATVVVPADLLVAPTARDAASATQQHRPQPAPPAQPVLETRPELPTVSSWPARPAPQRAEHLPPRTRAPEPAPAPAAGPVEEFHEPPTHPGALPRRRHAAGDPADPGTPLLSGTLDVEPDGRPALPQRVGSHLHPGLATQTHPAMPAGGHDPGLFAAIQAGRRRVEAEQRDAPSPPPHTHTSTDEGTPR